MTDSLTQILKDINSGKKDTLKTDIEKPIFINKLPLTNINNRTYNRNINNISHEEKPKKIDLFDYDWMDDDEES